MQPLHLSTDLNVLKTDGRYDAGGKGLQNRGTLANWNCSHDQSLSNKSCRMTNGSPSSISQSPHRSWAHSLMASIAPLKHHLMITGQLFSFLFTPLGFPADGAEERAETLREERFSAVSVDVVTDRWSCSKEGLSPGMALHHSGVLKQTTNLVSSRSTSPVSSSTAIASRRIAATALVSCIIREMADVSKRKAVTSRAATLSPGQRARETTNGRQQTLQLLPAAIEFAKARSKIFISSAEMI